MCDFLNNLCFVFKTCYINLVKGVNSKVPYTIITYHQVVRKKKKKNQDFSRGKMKGNQLWWLGGVQVIVQ